MRLCHLFDRIFSFDAIALLPRVEVFTLLLSTRDIHPCKLLCKEQPLCHTIVTLQEVKCSIKQYWQWMIDDHSHPHYLPAHVQTFTYQSIWCTYFHEGAVLFLDNLFAQEWVQI